MGRGVEVLAAATQRFCQIEKDVNNDFASQCPYVLKAECVIDCICAVLITNYHTVKTLSCCLDAFHNAFLSLFALAKVKPMSTHVFLSFLSSTEVSMLAS